ncbi:putative portal protein [Erwinia phage SunLIRen]|nr:putative portal protein [Erwinia phage SunLIRen]
MTMAQNEINPPLPAFQKDEMGSLGLKVISGRLFEEPRRNLRFPESIKTFQIMMRDPAIAASINILKTLVRRVNWRFDAPEGFDAKDYEERIKFFETLKGDMDVEWGDFINSIMSMCVYGFSLHEKVYKVRKGKKGKYPSRYNDKLIGWAKLPIRSQTTIDKWIFDDENRELIGARQNLGLIPHLAGSTVKNFIELPRSKFMLFRYDDEIGNPEGRSPLLNAYVPWKYKVQIEEFEAMGVSRDLVGMPMIGLPPEYLDRDADPEKKAFTAYCQNIINDINANNRAGLLFPRMIDPESKMDMFEFKLVSKQGAKSYNTDEIIDRYSKQIMMSFMSDVLAMGQSKYGSYSLADSKTSLLAMSVETILRQIQNVINKDLIPQTYSLNQWDDEEHVRIVFEDIEKPDLENIAAFIQRCISVGAMEVDKSMSTYLRGLLGLPEADESAPVSEKLSPNSQSKAGEGYKTSGEGTAKSPSGRDESVARKG